MLGTVLTVPGALAATVLVARVLGPGRFGSFGLISLLVPLGATLSDLGVSMALGRQAAEAVGAQDEGQIERLTQRISAWNAVRLPLTVAIGYVLLARSPAAWWLFLASRLIIQSTVGPLFFLTVRNLLAGPNLVNVVGVTLGAGAAISTAALTRSPELTFGVQAFFIAAPSLGLWFFIPGRARGAVLRLRNPFGPGTNYRFGFLAFWTGYLYSVLFTRTELVFFPVGAAGRGVFTAASGLAQRMTLLLDSVFATLPAGLAAVGGASGDLMTAGLVRSLRVTQTLVGASGPPLIGVTVLVATPLFGRGYTNLEFPILCLAAVSLAQSSVQPLLAWRYATQGASRVLPAAALAVALDLGLAALLVPRLGLAGAVIASVAGSICFVVAVTVPAIASHPTVGRPMAGVLAANVLALALGGVVVILRPYGPGPALVGVALTFIVPVLCLRWALLPSDEVLTAVRVAGLPAWAVDVIGALVTGHGSRCPRAGRG
jgi:hypothetical protein